MKLSSVFKKRDLYTIVFIGKTGVGKSSTLNILFDLNFKTDPAIACTMKPQYASIKYEQHKYKLVDLPGISESVAADKKYFKFYRKWIRKADVLVLVTQADTRAYKQDELFLNKTKMLFRKNLKLIVGLNKVDHFESKAPTSITEKFNSTAFLSYQGEKVEDVYEIFSKVVNNKIAFQKDDVVPYSVTERYRLDVLKKKILNF